MLFWRAVKQRGNSGDFDVEAFFIELARDRAEKFLELGQPLVVLQSDDEFAVFAVKLSAGFVLPEAEKIGGGCGVAAEVLHQIAMHGLLDRGAFAAGLEQLERWKKKANVSSERFLVEAHGLSYLNINV